ncbi:MAG: hypothetical protein JOZ67_10150 [Gammaproteobacteria bacterium]|nr:hypothetical protein [Gammaproteobacteria bacterium]MBV9697503.1 hypothetical protein [Gammaproteobacteria bacterium]
MQLTTRSKVLLGLAALVTAYVMFGPKDSDPIQPARATSAGLPRPQHAPAAGVSAPVARSLLALAHRVVEQTAAGSLFATHSWYVAPPPPPPPPVQVEAPPPKPTAPPLPFTYMGSYAPNGAKPVFFLTEGDRVFDVHVGDTLAGGTYTVDAFNNGVLTFTYKPLNQQQQLMTGGAQ